MIVVHPNSTSIPPTAASLLMPALTARTGNFENDKPGSFETAPAPVDLPCDIAPIGHHVDATGPPPDPDTSPDLNKLFCVYWISQP